MYVIATQKLSMGFPSLLYTIYLKEESLHLKNMGKAFFNAIRNFAQYFQILEFMFFQFSILLN